MQCKLLESMILIPWRLLTVDIKLLAVGLKEETDRAGLRLRPGCEHQAAHMITLPVDSEICAQCL